MKLWEICLLPISTLLMMLPVALTYELLDLKYKGEAYAKKFFFFGILLAFSLSLGIILACKFNII